MTSATCCITLRDERFVVPTRLLGDIVVRGYCLWEPHDPRVGERNGIRKSKESIAYEA